MSLRFRVALSFPGEHRPYVARVAELLAVALGRERVLYDAYYEAEFARPDLDTYLQALYHDESELIVVFLCAEYEKKEWCGLEWRAIRDLIKKRQAASVMPLRFDMTEIPGLFSTDGYLWLGDRTPENTADRILERLGFQPVVATPTVQLIGKPELPRVADRLFGRERELARLDAAWLDPQIRVVSLIAWGGVGKTSLVAAWADRLAERFYDGADYFEWSFYSQGSSDHNSASADSFLDSALRHFGAAAVADSQAAGPEKGARLAGLLAERRALLILDGLEPLQYPPGPLAGELKDAGLRALLRGLAMRNAGLCVVTSRQEPVDLGRWCHGAAPFWPLEQLDGAAGVKLLRSLGVEGSAAELAAAVEEVDGHALSLTLIGHFLRLAHGGDIRKRDRVDLYKADAKTSSHGHAFRAVAAYEQWLDAGDEDNRRQLAVLRLLGLFDRPAAAACIEVLRAPPVIEGLTEPLVGLAEDDWNLTLSALEACRLISREGGSLDAHPLIREYFARRLQGLDAGAGLVLPAAANGGNGAAWREAHGRLFDFLIENTEHQPATLAGLQPLYQAVYHGCQAGRQEEACAGVYRDRILRGTGDDGFYSTKKLGAFGADLGAVACFFETPWSRVSPSLTEADQAWLLNDAASCLRALGRLREAVEPMRAGLEGYAAREKWGFAARVASNLSELELTLGEVTVAVTDAKQSVVFADRSGDAFERMGFRTTLADARHQAGEEGAALELFREAEIMCAEKWPQYPLLSSLAGFWYCDLLLAPAERAAGSGRDARAPSGGCDEVERRATQTLDDAVKNSKSLLTIALDHLSLGRARLYRWLLEDRAAGSLAPARDETEKAVAGLRASGRSDYVPFGLLTRAWLRFAQGDEPGARVDLEEAAEIAERGSMRLFLADVALYRARFFGDRAALAEARRLVEECGYGRRRAEIADLEARLAGGNEAPE